MGASMSMRTTSEARVEMRQQPMAESVPSNTASAAETVPTIRLARMLRSQTGSDSSAA